MLQPRNWQAAVECWRKGLAAETAHRATHAAMGGSGSAPPGGGLPRSVRACGVGACGCVWVLARVFVCVCVWLRKNRRTVLNPRACNLLTAFFSFFLNFYSFSRTLAFRASI